MTERMRRVMAALAGKRFPLEDEKATQAAMALELGRAGVLAFREVPVAGGIIDFVVEMGEASLVTGRCVRIGIEVKIKGQRDAIRRQVMAYAADPALDGIVLATSKPVVLPSVMCGKPVAVVDLGRAWL